MFPINTPLKIKLNPLIIKIFDIDSLFEPKTFKIPINLTLSNTVTSKAVIIFIPPTTIIKIIIR